MQQLLNPDKYRVCDGVPFVVFVPKKTNKRKFKEANIPLNTLYPQLLTLYNKYKGKTFKFLPTTDDERSDKSYNEAIKRLGLMCGWHEEVSAGDQRRQTEGVQDRTLQGTDEPLWPTFIHHQCRQGVRDGLK